MLTETANLTPSWLLQGVQHCNLPEIIDIDWQGITKRTLCVAWKQLRSDFVSKRNFEGFGSETLVIEVIASVGKSTGFEINDKDIKWSRRRQFKGI